MPPAASVVALDASAGDRALAEAAGAYPWVLAWYSAQVDREYGRLDAAIERIDRRLEADAELAQQIDP